MCLTNISSSSSLGPAASPTGAALMDATFSSPLSSPTSSLTPAPSTGGTSIVGRTQMPNKFESRLHNPNSPANDLNRNFQSDRRKGNTSAGISSHVGNTTTTGSPHQPRNILVTGGCGFIASNVVNYLCLKYPGYKIVNFDCLDYCASRENVREAEQCANYEFVCGDIRNSAQVEKAFRDHNIDTVLHFAALSHVDLSYTSCSPSFVDVNLIGTHVMLEAARLYGVKRFIHVSTDEVYGETGSNCVNEEAPLCPTNPYAQTKAAAEMLVRCYINTYNMPIIITRGNNVYGPRQYPEKLIPKFICRLLRGQSCCLHGSGNTRRNFMYIEDAVRAFDVITHHGVLHEVYNIGCEEEFSVRDVAHLLVGSIKPLRSGEGIEKRQREWSVMDVKEWMECVEDRQYNDNNYRIDFTKLAALGWRPETRFEDGLKATISWYQQINVEGHWAGGALSALRAHPDKNQKSAHANSNQFTAQRPTNDFYFRFFDFLFFDDFCGFKSMREKVLSSHKELFGQARQCGSQRVVGEYEELGWEARRGNKSRMMRIRANSREDGANPANFTIIA